MEDSFQKNLEKVTPRTVLQSNLQTLDPEDTPAALNLRSSRKRSLKSVNKQARASFSGRAVDKAKRKKIKHDDSIDKFHMSSGDTSVLNIKGVDQTFADISAGADSSLSESSIDLHAVAKFRRQARTALKQSEKTSKNEIRIFEKTKSDVNKGDQTFEHINYSAESSFEGSLISHSSIRSSKRSKLNALSAEVTYADVSSNGVDTSVESISLDNAKFTHLRNRVRGAALTSLNTIIPSVISSQDISEQSLKRKSSDTEERSKKRGSLGKDLQSGLLEESVGKQSKSYIEDTTSSDLEDVDTTLDSIRTSARQQLSQRAPAIQLNVSSILKRIKTKPIPETIAEEEVDSELSGEKGEEIGESPGRSQSQRISQKDNRNKILQDSELNRSENQSHGISAGSLLPPPNFRDADNAVSGLSSQSISFSSSSSSSDLSVVRSNISTALSELNEDPLEGTSSGKSAAENVGGESKRVGSDDERTELPKNQNLRSVLEGSLQTVDPQKELGYSPRGRNRWESLDDKLKTPSPKAGTSMFNREETPSPRKLSPRKSIAESNLSPLLRRSSPRISLASKDRTPSPSKVTLRKNLSVQKRSPLSKNLSPKVLVARMEKTPSPSKRSPRKSLSRQNTPTPSKVIQHSDSSLQNSKRSSSRKKASLSNVSGLDSHVSPVPVESRSSLKSIVLSPREVELHPEEAIRAQQKLEQLQIDMAEREGSSDTARDETPVFESGSGEESEEVSNPGLNKESSLSRHSSVHVDEVLSSSFSREIVHGNDETSAGNYEYFVTEDKKSSRQHEEAAELPHVSQKASSSISHDAEEVIDTAQSLNSSHAVDLPQQTSLRINSDSESMQTATHENIVTASPEFMYLDDEADEDDEQASPPQKRESRNADSPRMDTHQITEMAEASDTGRAPSHKTGDPNASKGSVPEKFVTIIEPESGETSSDEELNLMPLIFRRTQATENNDSSISNSSIINEEVEMPQVTDEANVSGRMSDINEATQSGTVSETPKTKQMTLREFLQKLSTKPTKPPVSDVQNPKPEITKLLKGTASSISKSAPKQGKKPAGLAKKKIELPKSVPPSLTREIFTHYAKCKVSKEVLNYIIEASERFWKNTADDLVNIAQGKKGALTIKKEHVVQLMTRQGFIRSPLDLRILIEEYLPAEEWDVLLPTAYAHNKVYPPPDH